MPRGPHTRPPPGGDAAREGRDGANQGRAFVRRHGLGRRIAHWVWAVSLLFLATSGLNIFLAHPILHIGKQSGFEFDNAVLAIGAVRDAEGERIGVTEILGHRFETTGLLGVSNGVPRALPSWATTPSFPDLATARVSRPPPSRAAVWCRCGGSAMMRQDILNFGRCAEARHASSGAG